MKSLARYECLDFFERETGYFSDIVFGHTHCDEIASDRRCFFVQAELFALVQADFFALVQAEFFALVQAELSPLFD